MNTPEERWYNPEPPTDYDVEDLWPLLFEKIKDEVKSRIPKGWHAYLDKRAPEDLHISITSLEIIKEDDKQNLEDHLREMPTFDADDEEEDAHNDTLNCENENEDATEEEPEPEGGVALEDSEARLTERSNLLLCIEIREFYKGVITGGITTTNYKVIEVEHEIGMKVIRTLTGEQRRKLADILLYQSAQAAKREDLDDEEDEWMDLQSVIDMHLDMANMREFYKQIAGTA